MALVLVLAHGCGGEDRGVLGNDASTAGTGAQGGGGTGAMDGGTPSDGGGGQGGSVDGGETLSDGGTGDSSTVFETTDGGQVQCPDGMACACDNGLDDDGDGLIDGFDPECTGPYDDDESSFATGIPGDNEDPAFEDCFFDGNSGHEDDQCQYHSNCILCGMEDCGDGAPPQCGSRDCCEVSQDCVDFCAPRTPNGCDCFGCCTVTDPNGDEVSIRLQSSCDLDDLSTCETCVPHDECVNECGECELCLGKTEDDLPDSCSDGGGTSDGGTSDGGSGDDTTTYTCDGGEQVCSETEPCPDGYYCQQGCCQVTVF